MSKENKVLDAVVKSNGEKVQVYKLHSGGYNIYLGDKLSMPAIENKEHTRTFTKDQLQFTNS